MTKYLMMAATMLLACDATMAAYAEERKARLLHELDSSGLYGRLYFFEHDGARCYLVERELFQELNEICGVAVFRRNLVQSRLGGPDNQDAADLGISLEVKRQEKLNLPAWIAQAEAQAVPGTLPVVAYRRSREPWKFLIVCDAETMLRITGVICSPK